MDPLQVAPPASLVTEIQALQGAWVHGAITRLHKAGFSRLNPPCHWSVRYALFQSEEALAGPQEKRPRRPRRRRKAKPALREASALPVEAKLPEPPSPPPEPLPPEPTFNVRFDGKQWIFTDRYGRERRAFRLRDLVRRTIIPLGLGAQWERHPLGLKVGLFGEKP